MSESFSDDNIVENIEQEDNSNEQENIINPLDMSDDELENFSFDEDIINEKSKNGEENENNEGDKQTNSNSEEENLQNNENADNSPETSNENENSENRNEDSEDDNSSQDQDDAWDIEKLKKPFKANGTEMTINSVDEAIKLMQMGVGFSQKNADYKKGMSLIKTLESNEIDNNDLNLAISVLKGDKEAIQQILKRSEIDPLDLVIDEDNNNSYTPENYVIPEQQIDFDTVVQELQGNPKFDEVIQSISNQWDETSQEAISGNPEMLRTLTEQKETGVFDKVLGEVNKQKLLGNVPSNIPILEAYIQIGNQMAEAGLLADQSNNTEDNSNNNKSSDIQRNLKNIGNKAQQKQQINNSIIDKKKAASVNTMDSGNSDTPKITKNPLEMSDEEFEKTFGDVLI